MAQALNYHDCVPSPVTARRTVVSGRRTTESLSDADESAVRFGKETTSRPHDPAWSGANRPQRSPGLELLHNEGPDEAGKWPFMLSATVICAVSAAFWSGLFVFVVGII